ncbi:MAG TPA: helicase HerA-like domain-containing protein [Candidatus Limnocylindrales bacterium]
MGSTDLEKVVREGYGWNVPAIELGAAAIGGKTDPAARVRLPLQMANRHGLVAGATGTGKTKTLQLLTEQLSDGGVPVFLVDIKGDISGLGAGGQTNDRIKARLDQVGMKDWQPQAYPVEFLTLEKGGRGARVRATVGSFGPILLSKVLQLNDTQESVLSLVFKYADDQQLPLVDLSDLRATLNFLNGDEGKKAMAEYGGLAPATVGVILRNIVGLEQQGAESFFGQPEFDVEDLLETRDGRGLVSILEVADMQDRPKLFSTFLMWLLAEVYHDLPEVGDLDKPKLVFFFDEAHLLFEDANKSFLSQIEMVVRLVRSKGVGVYFVTQSPEDVPPKVLAQLGNRVQHALRAFTPNDQQMIDATARTFPTTKLYDVAAELTSLGTGEGLVSVLGPNGVPTPTVHCVMRPPRSLMAQLDEGAFTAAITASKLVAEYAVDVDPQSAKEMLAVRMQEAQGQAVAAKAQAQAVAAAAKTQAQIEKEYARQQVQATKAYQKAQADAARAQARDEARAQRASHRGSNSGSSGGLDWGEAAKLGTRVLTSSTTNTLLRGIFGTLTGSPSRRRRR